MERLFVYCLSDITCLITVVGNDSQWSSVSSSVRQCPIAKQSVQVAAGSGKCSAKKCNCKIGSKHDEILHQTRSDQSIPGLFYSRTVFCEP